MPSHFHSSASQGLRYERVGYPVLTNMQTGHTDVFIFSYIRSQTGGVLGLSVMDVQCRPAEKTAAERHATSAKTHQTYEVLHWLRLCYSNIRDVDLFNIG